MLTYSPTLKGWGIAHKIGKITQLLSIEDWGVLHIFWRTALWLIYQLRSAPTSPRVQDPDKIGIQSNLDRYIQAIFGCMQWIC